MFIQVTRLVMGEKVVQHVNTGQIVYIAPMTKGCELVLGNRERWQVVESAEEVLMKVSPHPLPLETRINPSPPAPSPTNPHPQPFPQDEGRGQKRRRGRKDADQ